MKLHFSETQVIGAAIVSFLILLTPGLMPVLGATYTVTLQTDKSAYYGAQPITISGAVSPPPGPETTIVIVIKNPNGIAVGIEDNPVNGTTGAFSEVTVPGGSANWVAGTYSVNGTWGGSGVLVSKLVTFSYSLTTSTTSPTTTIARSSTTSTSTTAIPPVSVRLGLALLFTVAILATYVAARRIARRTQARTRHLVTRTTT
jgi:hypothetical protein